MLPVGVGGLAITYAYLRWAYRAELREPFRERLETVPVTLDRPLVLKALALFGVAVIAWLGGGSLSGLWSSGIAGRPGRQRWASNCTASRRRPRGRSDPAPSTRPPRCRGTAG